MIETEPRQPDLLEDQPQAPIQAERAPHLLLAGDPFLARQLKQQLPQNWRITLIHPEAEGDGSGDDFQTFRGDPTSALALQRAGATEARALLAALPDAVETYEVCRIARAQLHVPKVIAVVPSRADVAPFQELDIEVVIEAAVIATAVRNLVEQGSQAVENVGLGQGELVQISLQASSPVVGRRLRVFRQHGWTVAAIFRGDRLVIPTADTVLLQDDRLLLVGEPERLRTIGEYLRVGRAQFPLPYGSRIAGPVWGRPSREFLEELAYLAHGVGLRRVQILIAGRDQGWESVAQELDLPIAIDWARADLEPVEAVSEALRRFSPGCLVVPPGPARLPRPFAGLTRPLERALHESRGPLLVPRGGFPYERVLLPVFRTPLPQGPVQAAFDLSEQLHTDLVTLHVQAPSFLEGHSDDVDVITAALDEVAALRRGRIQQHEHRVGNPLAEISRVAGPRQLVVLSHRRGRRWRSLRPDVSAYLTQRLPSSVLVLPLDS